MKYLVISRTKESFYVLPPDKLMELRRAVVAFIDKLRKQGIIKEIYNMPGLKAAAFIFEVASPEEANRLFYESPMLPFQDFEPYVLSDWDDHVKVITQT
jgi:muconolactone delta-isomerase